MDSIRPSPCNIKKELRGGGGKGSEVKDIPVLPHPRQTSPANVNAELVRVCIYAHRFNHSFTSQTTPITSHTPPYHHPSIPTSTSTPADVALTNVAPADDVYDDVPFADVAHADVAHADVAPQGLVAVSRNSSGEESGHQVSEGTQP